MPWGCVGLEGFVVGFHLEVQHHKPVPDNGDGGQGSGPITCLQTPWSPHSHPSAPHSPAPDPPGPMQKPAMMPTTQATLT